MARSRAAAATPASAAVRAPRRANKLNSQVESLLSDAATVPEPLPSRKRKRTDVDKAGGVESRPAPISRNKAPRRSKAAVADDEVSVTPTTQSKETKSTKEPVEGRLRRFRTLPPSSFSKKLERAQTQRMIVIERKRVESANSGHPVEEISIVGSTGNIYQVTIDKVPSCTCPDHLKGNECKHKVYALRTVLKAPEHLQYQLALLTSELNEIFDGAPPVPTDAPTSDDKDGKRKPIEGECPICYMDFDLENNETVWCKAACGNNMHKTCFEQWAASQRGSTVKCVYCRTSWEMDKESLNAVMSKGQVGEDGYVNVAEQFGMSGERDYSTYHRHWVRRMGFDWDY